MTTITIHTHRPEAIRFWIAGIVAALVAAGLAVGLVFAFTGDSDDGTTTPSSGPIVTTTDGSGGTGAPSLCPGSLKDWSC